MMKNIHGYEWKPMFAQVMGQEQARKEFANGRASNDAKIRQLLEQNDHAYRKHKGPREDTTVVADDNGITTASSGIVSDISDAPTKEAYKPKLQRGENPRNFMLSNMREELFAIERLLRSARPQSFPVHVRKQARKKTHRASRSKREVHQAFQVTLSDVMNSRHLQPGEGIIAGHADTDLITNISGGAVCSTFFVCGLLVALVFRFLVFGRRSATKGDSSKARLHKQIRTC